MYLTAQLVPIVVKFHFNKPDKLTIPSVYFNQAWDCKDFCLGNDPAYSGQNFDANDRAFPVCVKCGFVGKILDEKFRNFEEIVEEVAESDQNIKKLVQNFKNFQIIGQQR
jgi:hypothetical protein